MKNIFNQPQKTKVGSNTFDLSHQLLTTTGFGLLTPIFCQEVVPGDDFKISTAMLGRTSPFVHPIMQGIDYYVHYFYVPNRILWDGWNDFIKPREDPTSWNVDGAVNLPTDPDYDPDLAYAASNPERVAPYVNYPAEAYKIVPPDPQKPYINERALLPNFFGLPNAEDIINYDGNVRPKISPLPFQAYQMIWSDYYRDENLATQYSYKLTDGDNTGTNNAIWNDQLSKLRYRAYPRDYLTSALPAPQKGVEAMLPISDGTVLWRQRPSSEQNWPKWVNPTGTNATSGSVSGEGNSITVGTTTQAGYDPASTLWVDFNDASIVNLRRAIALQQFLELDARGGTRINESIYNHFGVRVSDARVQRPEFMGGYKQTLKVSEVLQTSRSDKGTNNDDNPSPLGAMAGHGITIGAGQSVGKYVEEHGHIIGILSVVPRQSYWPAIAKKWSKFDRFDYFWPMFAHIGEQAILNQELVFDGAGSNKNTEPFGYTPRYSEYKFQNSYVAGEFKSSLANFHLGRKFAEVPNLNQKFIEIDPTENSRIFAVTADVEQYNALWFQIRHNVKAKRKMPYFGNPKIV